MTVAVTAGFTACTSLAGGPSAAVQPSASPAPVAVTPPRAIVLAEGSVPSLPPGPLAWVTERVSFYERPITHSHEAAFVYAAVTPSRLSVPTGARTLMPGQASFVPAGVWHTHERTCDLPTECHDSFWEIRVAPPDSPPPSGDMPTARVFVSPAIPVAPGAPARLRFELIHPADIPGAAADGGYTYIRIPRDGLALAWRVVQ